MCILCGIFREFAYLQKKIKILILFFGCQHNMLWHKKKYVFADNRQSLTTENLEKLVIVFCNQKMQAREKLKLNIEP